MKNKKKKKSSPALTILLVLLILVSLSLIGTGVYLVFFKNKDAYDRQSEEKDLADTYIDDLILQLTDPEAYEELIRKRLQEKASKLLSGHTGEPGESESQYDFSELDYEDENYYMRDGIVYTPDYARGVIDCVLEVPAAGIRRGVYTGTWDDINFDLDIWMVTAARPDYKLGETHYCIYGHNHTLQDLSFNRLKDVKVGDNFYLTAASGRYIYDVTNVFAVSRDSATRDYVDNFSITSDKCYIITCGRDDGVNNYRYLDLIVEGTLKEVMSIEDYAAIRNKEKNKK